MEISTLNLLLSFFGFNLFFKVFFLGKVFPECISHIYLNMETEEKVRISGHPSLLRADNNATTKLNLQ